MCRNKACDVIRILASRTQTGQGHRPHGLSPSVVTPGGVGHDSTLAPVTGTEACRPNRNAEDTSAYFTDCSRGQSLSRPSPTCTHARAHSQGRGGTDRLTRGSARGAAGMDALSRSSVIAPITTLFRGRPHGAGFRGPPGPLSGFPGLPRPQPRAQGSGDNYLQG